MYAKPNPSETDGGCDLESREFAKSFRAFRTEPGRVSSWVDRMLKAAERAKEARWLDVGCGMGRFATPLAGAGIQVIGVDRSVEMIRRALLGSRGTGLWFLSADGCRLPFRSESFGCALISMVLEHVEDRTRLLAEVARVLTHRCVLLVRTCSETDLDETTWYRFFPEALRREKERMPSISQLHEMLSQLGFGEMQLKRYVDVQRIPVATFLAKLKAKAYTMLWQLSADDFEDCLARAERDLGATADTDEVISASMLAWTRD